MFVSTVGLCCRRRTRKKLIFLLVFQASFNGTDISGWRGAGQSCGRLFSVCVNMNDVNVNDFRWCEWAPTSAGMSTLTRWRKGLCTVQLRKP